MHACSLYDHVGSIQLRNVRNNVSRRDELWRMKTWQCVVFAHYNVWRIVFLLCSSSQYGMAATRGPIIYTRGMVDDTKQIRKSYMEAL